MGRVRVRSTALATALVLALGGCASYDVTSPHDARDNAKNSDGASAGASAGTVDCRKLRCVALTFDGGPSAPTPKLLDLLRRKHVHATFFLQGKGHITQYPGTVHRMAADGNEVGNHTWTHKVLTDLGPDGIRAELAPVQDAIEKITGHRPDLMRPPEGRTDRKVSKVCHELGLAQILWSVTAKDYQTTDTALITQRVLGQVRRDGIVLLHERYAGTIPAVPGIINTLQARGYTLVTVSQLLAPAAPEPGMVYRP
jgi:peptidoglycan/xylan/chitin deacetylase (PgdA/CDA1 family)